MKVVRNVYTLCGSVRFREHFDRVAAELTFRGYVVLSLNVWGTETTGYIGDGDPRKKTLEEVHLRHIDLSEGIIVINRDGYVGRSTTGEIEYARKHRKKVYWLERNEPEWKDLLLNPPVPVSEAFK